MYTTSGSLNLLTPSSTTSRIKDFTSRIQERAASGNVQPGNRLLLAQASNDPTPTVTPIGSYKTEDLKPNSKYSNPDLTSFDRYQSKTDNLSRSKHQEPIKSRSIQKQTENTLKPPPKVVINDSTSHRSRGHHRKREEISHKKPSYLNLACSVNGYTNLTTYDSKLRQNISRSREASPIRPITHIQYKEYSNSLVVPVPVSSDKLLVPTFGPHDPQHLTSKAPAKALTDPYLATSPILIYMAAENQQLKKDFFNQTSSNQSFMSTESRNFATSMLHSKTNDQVDNASAPKDITFKSSYSETNITSKKVNNTSLNGTGSKIINTESYTIYSSNGVSKRVDITKENDEKLPSPMKSFIQQRVERLYGPGALAQGFFNQKRHKNKSQCEDNEQNILTEKSLNIEQKISVTPQKLSSQSRENLGATSPNGSIDENGLSPPVLRHLRPEFRAQLPILSPKKAVRTSGSPNKVRQIPVEIETLNGTPESLKEVLNGASNGVNNKIPCEIVTDRLGTLNISDSTDLNGSVTEDSVLSNGDVINGDAKPEKDAYYFLALKKKETDRLMALAAIAEGYLESLQNEEVSEEVLGLLRSTAGKSRLLATQKMQQFEGLCYNNINEGTDSPFPTTLQDLCGFWDMVLLQVRHVDALHDQVERVRASQWRELSPAPSMASPSTPQSGGKPRARTSAATTGPQNERAKAAAEKREQDRKALLEHRRRLARERQAATRGATPGTSREHQQGMSIEGSQEVEIFVGKGAKPSKVAPKGDCRSTNDSDDSFFDRS